METFPLFWGGVGAAEDTMGILIITFANEEEQHQIIPRAFHQKLQAV